MKILYDDPNEVGVFGYRYTDYTSKQDLSLEWLLKHSNRHSFIEGVCLDDAKPTIHQKHIGAFFRYLDENLGRFDITSGGGGENTNNAFGHLDQKIRYFDTSTNPRVAPTRKKSCFAEKCSSCASIVMNRYDSDNSRGCNDAVSLKNKRGDNDEFELPNFFKKEVEDFLAKERDVCVNSISNPALARLIAEKAKARVYTLITPHFDLKKEEFGRLLRRSDGVQFSLREFVSMIGKKDKWTKKLECSIGHIDFQEIAKEVEEFVRERGVVGYVAITHGGQGAVIHPTRGAQIPFSIVLKPEQRNEVNHHITSNNISTNRCGDYYFAAFSQMMRRGERIEDAAVFANLFVMRNVLKYDEPFGLRDFEVINLKGNRLFSEYFELEVA